MPRQRNDQAGTAKYLPPGGLYAIVHLVVMCPGQHNQRIPACLNCLVWDKAATIRFRKTGKGKVRPEFRLTALCSTTSANN